MCRASRASMNSVSRRRSRELVAHEAVRLVAGRGTTAETGICVVKNSWPGRLTMQSTRSASTMALADFALARLLAGERTVGQHEARDAVGREVMDEVLHPGEVGVAAGGTPYRQRSPERSLSPPQSLSLKGGLASTKSALRPGCRSSWKLSAHLRPEICLDAADGEVHLGEAPGGGVRLLAEDRDVVSAYRYAPRRTARTARTCRPSRSRGRRRGP